MSNVVLLLFQRIFVFIEVNLFVINTAKYFLYFGLIFSIAAFKTSEQARQIIVKTLLNIELQNIFSVTSFPA